MFLGKIKVQNSGGPVYIFLCQIKKKKCEDIKNDGFW